LLRGLIEGGLSPTSAGDWRRSPSKNISKTPSKLKPSHSNNSSGSTPVQSTAAQNLASTQPYHARYKTRKFDSEKEAKAWWLWVDHSSTSASNPYLTSQGSDLSDSTSHAGSSVVGGGGGSIVDTRINGIKFLGQQSSSIRSEEGSFRFDDKTGKFDGSNNNNNTRRKLSINERKAEKRAKKRGEQDKWAEQNQRRVRRLECYHQRALQKRLVAVLKEGAAR
jgi:hypothetical protein